MIDTILVVVDVNTCIPIIVTADVIIITRTDGNISCEFIEWFVKFDYGFDFYKTKKTIIWRVRSPSRNKYAFEFL